MNILIIDTDTAAIAKYQEWLIIHNIFVASTAQDGLSLLSRYPMQIILMQHFLEDMELDVFIARINKEYPTVHIIVLSTARPSESLFSTLISHGADAVLYKPFSYEQLRLFLQYFKNKRPQHPPVRHL